jgi:hypothetical protein
MSQEPEAPNWAFSPDQGIKCPTCDATLSGLNWKLDTADKLTHMILVPCGHELSTEVWELSFSGRDRRLGTVIRTPKFQRKDGS